MREDGTESGWVMDLQEALAEPLLAMRIEKHFGKIVRPDADKFTALHYAFFNSGVVVFIPRGAVARRANLGALRVRRSVAGGLRPYARHDRRRG